MDLSEIRQLDEQYLIQNYGSRLPFSFVKGEGCYLYDTTGKRYLDWLAGIAVNTLGYAHPKLTAALQAQVAAVMHTSNYFLIEPQARLAKLLVEHSGLDRAFFCNSGAEANEALLKLARRWASAKWGEGERFVVVTCEGSFHGRTFATLTATGQAKVQAGFAPLMPGFRHVPFEHLAAAEEAIDDQTIAFLVEPVQGEGGINVASDEYLLGLRELCNERGILLLFDEVQCGVGRTGQMFAHLSAGIKPDAMALAKGLGGGVPIGAVVCSQELADELKPGSHGTTFGGNPLATRAGQVVVETILSDGLMQNAVDQGKRLTDGLKQLCDRHEVAKGVRGKGLMLALLLADDQSVAVRDACADEGLIVNAVKPDVIRIVPPLILSSDEVDEGLAKLDAALAKVG